MLDREIEIILRAMPKNTARATRTAWRAWSDLLGGVKGIETSREARIFLADEKAKLNAQSTIYHKIIILKSFYDKLKDMEAVIINPFEMVAKELKKGTTGNRRPTKLTPFDQIKGMFKEAGRRKDKLESQAMLAMLYGAGRRIGELNKITLNDVKLTEKNHVYVVLRETKNGQDFNAVVPDCYKHYILDLLEARKQATRDLRSPLFTKCYKTLYRHFKDMAGRLGLEITPHSGRATAITYLLDQGCDYQQVKDFSGHCSVSMVERYDKRRYSLDKSAALKINL